MLNMPGSQSRQYFIDKKEYNMKDQEDILVINPGSTTTKIAIFRSCEKGSGMQETDGHTSASQDQNPSRLEQLFEETITHDPEQIKAMGGIFNQLEFREKLIRDTVAGKGYDLGGISAAVGRGGMIIGLHGGGYIVTPELCSAMKDPANPPHASSLGAQLAYDIATPLGVPSYIYDSTMGCELKEIAKISGLEGIDRYGCCHVLNSRAQAMRYARSIGREYKDMNFIVAHMGGGITVSAHEKGQITDDSSYDAGPMSPERTGGIPLILWTKLCFSGKYTEEQVEKLISGQGGLVSYLGVTDCRQVEDMIKNGDEKAALVYEAMAYQVAKAIGEMSVALKGKVDAIILTGGVAHSRSFTDMIKEYAGHLGPVVVMAGEKEMEALAEGAYRILKGEEKGRIY